MRDERARRRPKFCPGLDLRLADGQIWSFPSPGQTAGEEGAPAPESGPEATWNDPRYRAIVEAVHESQDEGDRFRAELALAIHLLNWNYVLDPDDLEDLLDDHGESRRRADVSCALNQLARAHQRPLERAADGPSKILHHPEPDGFRLAIGRGT